MTMQMLLRIQGPFYVFFEIQAPMYRLQIQASIVQTFAVQTFAVQAPIYRHEIHGLERYRLDTYVFD